MRGKVTIYRSLILAMLTLGTISCTEIIDIELDSTFKRLVVYGTVTTDSIRHQVRLTTSSDYFSNKPSPQVPGALVELEFNNSVLRLEEHDTIPGLYLTPYAFRGIPGITYQLRISEVDVDEDGKWESYFAESTMPEGLVPDSIALSYFQSPFVSGYQVFMYGQEPPTREWYGFKIWRNSDLLTDTVSKFSVQSDDFINGTYIYGIPVGFLWDGDPREAVQPGDTITLELNCIEQVFYDFVLDAQLEIMGNNPLFSGPPANIRTNLDQDARGIFAAYSLNRVSTMRPNQ